MKTRIFRVLVCLAVVCALLVSISPIRTQASTIAAGASIAVVAANPYIVAAAALVCLGVMLNPNTPIFMENAVANVAGVVTNLGSEVYRVIDAAGNAMYYVTAETLNAVRSAAIDAGIIYNQAQTFSAGDTISISNGDTISVQQTCHYVKFVGKSVGVWSLYEYVFSDPDQNLSYYLNGADTLSQGTRMTCTSRDHTYRVYQYSKSISAAEAASYPSIGTADVDYSMATVFRIVDCFENGLLGMAVAEGFSCGIVSSVPIDGSSALSWTEEYGSRQLRLLTPKGDGNPGGDSGGDDGDSPQGGFVENVLFPLTLLGSILDTAELTQQDQWSGDVPSNVPDADVVLEYEILDAPEIDGFQGLQVCPVPDATPDSGSGTDPEGGTSSGGDVSYTLDLTEYFPFCIPFDIYEFLSLLAADPEAPVFQWVIPVPQMDAEFPVTVDLSAWNGIAKLFRTLELLAFIVGLGKVTRDKFIRG